MERPRALRNILAHVSVDALADSFLDEFPWISVLPSEDIGEFVKDFIRAAGAAAELGQWSVLSQTIREWRATAAVYAEPGLADKLRRPVTDDHGPVRPPVEPVE